MHRRWLAACTGLALACSRPESGMVPQNGSGQTGAGGELIPAEWTVGEDTAETGEVTTLSLQLPSAREIGGLVNGAAPRIILRCLHGKVAAFIDTASAGNDSAASGGEAAVGQGLELVEVQLDSAPACE